MTVIGEPESVRQRVREVLDKITRAAGRVGREPATVRLVVATKGVPVDDIAQALEAGVRDIGENRLQEALPKIEALGRFRKDLVWHFIGRLQRRKVRTVVGLFDAIQSVDSVELAAEINRRASAAGLSQRILLEVNLGEEPSKAGFRPSEVGRVLPALDAMPGIAVTGLMAIPPYSADAESSRPHFRCLRELARSLSGVGLQRVRMGELSMGMSHDYEVAVEEGASMVRVGTAIFGRRDA